jgi:hypothetical protein
MTKTQTGDTSESPPAGSVGVWKIDKDEPAAAAPGKSLLWHDTFVYHQDGTLSLQLLTVSPRGNESKDGVYRLETFWEEGTLFYRLPGGVKVELAAFRNHRFEMDGDGARRLYRRVEPSELNARELSLLDAARPVFR